MKAYKPEQGRMARMATFWSLALLLLFGCQFLHQTLSTYVSSMKNPIADLTIPIVSIPLSPSFLLATAVFAGGMFWLYNWQQTPKVADLLIETEQELRKVTWPTMQDVVNSSLVVIISVAILMAFLAGSDWALGGLVKRLIFGWGA
ncbi:MAG: preprotein translocase subunit SecE [Planctomycetota bacterium]